MAFEVPTDLIRQVQISLRKESGLSSYDPDDPNLHPLPSLAESIADFDPSPAYLRCKHCKGRLLRGLQSAICVYCGRGQSKDLPPEPIPFKSTIGYQWLLQSLDLDGSETLGPSIDEHESNRGQSSQKDEILLSDLLNLEIVWPAAELGKSETSITDNVRVQSQSSLNLTGVDLDNYFSESKNDTISDEFEELPVISKRIENIETNASENQKNLTLASEDKKSDPFSGWQADFQSADSKNQNEDSKPFDQFSASTVDLSTHMDSVFGPGKDLKNEKQIDDSAPFSSMNNVSFQDDLWNNSTYVVSHQAEQFDATIKAENDIKADGLSNPSSASVDWFQDNQWQTSSSNAPDIKTMSEDDDDDSFDVWNDFTSSSSAQDPSKSSLKQSGGPLTVADEQASEITLFSSTNNFQDMDFGSFLQPDLFSASSSNQNDSKEVNNMQLEIPASERIAEAKVGAGGNVGQASEDGDVKASTQPNNDVESLLSQMHDLSFMLDSNLSVPSKPGGFTSSSPG